MNSQAKISRYLKGTTVMKERTNIITYATKSELFEKIDQTFKISNSKGNKGRYWNYEA